MREKGKDAMEGKGKGAMEGGEGKGARREKEAGGRV